ncbi:Glutathione peroxidase-like peroxiredoxin HYR1 [Fusarium oxysporum f. sp. albedinis]|nr:Glutathione peroxidase-like peroxiredoxin HYR1 [Fusarium oxysporum f. sp. albedinis]
MPSSVQGSPNSHVTWPHLLSCPASYGSLWTDLRWTHTHHKPVAALSSDPSKGKQLKVALNLCLCCEPNDLLLSKRS